MDAKKSKALEAEGWKFGHAGGFLELSDEERQLLDTRVSIALAIRQQRQILKLSQKELGARSPRRNSASGVSRKRNNAMPVPQAR